MQDATQTPERKRRLRDLVSDAFDLFSQTADIPSDAIDKGVNAIVDSIGQLARTPSVDEVAAIVKIALEKSGEGLGVAADAAGEAAEAAGDIAEKIVDGLSDLDLNI